MKKIKCNKFFLGHQIEVIEKLETDIGIIEFQILSSSTVDLEEQNSKRKMIFKNTPSKNEIANTRNLIDLQMNIDNLDT